MNLTRIARGIALAAATAAMLAATAAHARELKASVHLPPKNDTVAHGYVPFIKYVDERSKGELKIKPFYGGALLGPRAANQGVRDGIVDIGYVIVGYHTAEYPYLGGFANDVSAIGTNPIAAVAATSEWMFQHCAACLKEFETQGNVFTSAGAVPGMVIMSKTKVEKLSDFAGKKIRSNGGFWDEFIKSLGGVPVNIASSEQYEAMNRGLVDATIHVPSSLKTYGLWDMTKDVTMTNFGIYRSLNTFAVNPATWKSLTPAQRKILLDSALDANIDIAYGYLKTGDVALEESKKKGITVHAPPPDVKAKVDEFIKQAVAAGASASKTKYNIVDPDKHVATLNELTAKWEKIWDETGGDVAKFKARARAEITDKVDTATYFVK